MSCIEEVPVRAFSLEKTDVKKSCDGMSVRSAGPVGSWKIFTVPDRGRVEAIAENFLSVISKTPFSSSDTVTRPYAFLRGLSRCWRWL